MRSKFMQNPETPAGAAKSHAVRADAAAGVTAHAQARGRRQPQQVVAAVIAGLATIAVAATGAAIPAAANPTTAPSAATTTSTVDSAAAAAALSDDYVDGSEPVGDTEWLDDASDRKRVFIQTTGTSALMALSSARKKGRNTSAARSTARAVAAATITRTDAIVDAVQQFDPAAFEMYGSQYTIPGVAVEATAAALRRIEERPDVVTIVELPYYQRPVLDDNPALDSTTASGIGTANKDSVDLVKAIDAWKAGHTGQDVVVAVADSGFDYTHSLFGGAGTTSAYNAAKANPGGNATAYDSSKIAGMIDLAGTTGNGQNPDNNPIPTGSGSDHGTHVAGIVAGWGVNANGTKFVPNGGYGAANIGSQVSGLKIGPGMAPNAKLWPIKIFADGSDGTSLGVASMEYVAQQVARGQRIDIINQSIGSDWANVANTYKESALQVLNQYGIIVVISQGNGGDYVDIGGSPGIQERALTVGSADKNLQMSGFSSRGAHGSFDGRVKPDLTAIGGGIVSAYSGTGSNGTPASGTSMSAPMTAGSAAVAIGAHPTWRERTDNAALRFKALMMNTASTGVTNSAGKQYSLTRSGTGVINTADAAKSNVWLASDQNDHLVTASFGIVEVAGPTTLTRTVTVHNDGATQVTFNTKYVPFIEVPGVTFTTSPAQISIAPGATASVTVTLSIPDPTALRRTIDPTMSTTTSAGGQRQYVTEASGILDLQSTDPANVPWLRLGVFAAPKPASAIVGEAPVFAGADPLTGTLTLGGSSPNFGNTPLQQAAQPLTMGFQWGVTDDNNNVDVREYTRRSADTDLIGAATNAPQQAEKSNGTLYFAISGRSNRARPVAGFDSVAAAIELTTKFNGAQYRLELIQPKNQGSAEKDDRYIVRTIRVSDGAVVETQSVNGEDAWLDTNVFDNNVWILTVNLKNIGFASGHSGSTEITYKARLIADGLNDDTATVTYDVYNPDLWFERPSSWNNHFVKSIAGTDLIIHRKSQSTNAKVLLVNLHNTSGMRTQVLDVPADAANSSIPPQLSGLPRVGHTLTATRGQWTGAATFTYAYQWLRGGQPISGATGTSYAVVSGDEGAAISVRVTATRGSVSGTATSASVTVHDGTPVATIAPVISGIPVPGATLTADRGTWLDADGATYAYQWLRGGQPISGATGATYAVTAQDERAGISVAVSATLIGRTGHASSAAVSIAPLVGSVGSGSSDESSAGLQLSLSAATQAFGTGGVTATVRVPRSVVASGASVQVRSGSVVLGQVAVPTEGGASPTAEGFVDVSVPVSASAAVGTHALTGVYRVAAGSGVITLTSAPVAFVVTGGSAGAGGTDLPGGAHGGAGGAVSGTKVAKKTAKVRVKVSKKKVRAGQVVKVRVRVTVASKNAKGKKPASKKAKGKIAIRVGKKTVKVVKLKKGKRVVKIKLKKAGKWKVVVRYRGTAKVQAARAKPKTVRVLRAV